MSPLPPDTFSFVAFDSSPPVFSIIVSAVTAPLCVRGVRCVSESAREGDDHVLEELWGASGVSIVFCAFFDSERVTPRRENIRSKRCA